MVKKKKKTKNTVSVFGRQLPAWVLIVGFFVVAMVGFAGYNAYLDYQDKQKFARMEETVNALVNRLDNEFEISKIENTSYCYVPGHKLESVQAVCVYEQSITGQFTKPVAVEKFIENQTDLISVREKNTKNLYLVSSNGRNCNYEYGDANQIIFSCMSNTAYQYYPYSVDK